MTSAALLCLSSVIYHEARGESTQGQMAVAQVVLNRVKSPDFPNTVCGVVKQSNQFSWYPSKGMTNEKRELAKRVVIRSSSSSYHESPISRALYFRRGEATGWWKRLSFIKQIGKHKFYGN